MNGARQGIAALWARAALPFPLRVPLTTATQLLLRGVEVPYALRVQVLSGTSALTTRQRRLTIHAGQDAELPPGLPFDCLLAAGTSAGTAARTIVTFETDHHAACATGPGNTHLAAALARQVFRAPNAQWRAAALARQCQLPETEIHDLLAQGGTSLAAVVERQRVIAALVQMMTTRFDLRHIAMAVGLDTPAAMRAAFRRAVDVECDALERPHMHMRRRAHRRDDAQPACFPAGLPRGFFSPAQQPKLT
ncbi:MAG: helix-turn-helix transcriptional regulator [Burkholderiales bacterium]|nr:hypothetical protein [Burkholderiales bacterium]MDE2287967.1 helix-turn-helix transcriptional regulator [Burkholderiales bacterium]MDE2610371.1 helix-turn-helix transcriptional regulator [Burkholderiales bacterium]